MKNLLAILVLLVAVFVGYKAIKVAGIETSAPVKTAYDRVTETRTLRCAYAGLPPFISVNANTGSVEGPYKPIMEDVAKRLGLTLEWAEEVGYGQISAGLQAGRYDAFCGVLWATTIRASAILFTDPLYYIPVHACVGANTTEYDVSTDVLNSPDKTFAGYDGDISTQLVTTLFPKAKVLTVAPTASAGEWMEQIATGKADAVATCDKIFAANYIASNPGKVKVAAPDKPLTHIRDVMGVAQGEDKLKAMLDQALFEMVADGSMEKHLRAGLGDQYQYLVPRLFKDEVKGN